MLIRYPGSKDKHLKFLTKDIELLVKESRKIVEPFSGTASITFHLLKNKKVDGYWINDYDVQLISLWKIVKNNPDALISLVKGYCPHAQDFYEFKENPGETELEQAFRKLALHQISYSGLGGKAGGPIGGRQQKGTYLVDCRWNPIKLSQKIIECSNLLNSTKGKITSLDWSEVIDQSSQRQCLLYLDPPYFVRGRELYLNGVIDHQLLASTLRNYQSNPWAVSYDDAPEVREMYQWASVTKVGVTSHLHHKSISDVFITR